MPPTDFSTEGMSEQAQKQIEELTMQKTIMVCHKENTMIEFLKL